MKENRLTTLGLGLDVANAGVEFIQTLRSPVGEGRNLSRCHEFWVVWRRFVGGALAACVEGGSEVEMEVENTSSSTPIWPACALVARTDWVVNDLR